MFSGLFRSLPSQPRPQRAPGASVSGQVKSKSAASTSSAKGKTQKADRRQKSHIPLGGEQTTATGGLPSSLSAASGKKSRRKQAAAAAGSVQPEPAGGERDEPKLPGKKRKRQAGSEGTAQSPAPKLLLSTVSAGSTPVGRAAERLKGSRFRWLNDRLYSITGSEAKELYDQDPTLATAYHDGFRAQRAKWPKDPLDNVISWLRREMPTEAVIGDFGCGEARLALELRDYKVHSFDLLPVNERVTPCNLAEVPLPNGSIDVAVFCLALMGTDWPAFLSEARRCLRPKGLMHIVEVESRFADVDAVVKRIEAIGFRKVLFRPGNFFLELRFARTGGGDGGGEGGREGVHRSAKARRRARGRGAASPGHSEPGAKKGGELLQGCVYRRR